MIQCAAYVSASTCRSPRLGLATVGLMAVFAWGACSGKSTQRTSVPSQKSLTIFLTTEFKGSIEPCGCTADPLGDLARTARLINDTRAEGKAVLYIDGGSTLFSTANLAKSLIPQETLKSTLLRTQMRNNLHVDAIGLGPLDLALGKNIGPRHAVNIGTTAGIKLAPPQIIDAGGLKVGVFGVVSPRAMAPLGITATDPKAAAQMAVTELRANGAQLVIGILHMVRGEAVRLAREVPGMDFGLVGRNAPEPDRISDEPISAGNSWLIEPANRGQVVSRLDITYRGKSPDHPGFADALGQARAKRELEELPLAEKRLVATLTKWKADPSADPEFIKTKETELVELRARAETLRTHPINIPKAGSYFVFEQVRINKTLACDPAIVTAKRAYDKAAGIANVKAMADVKPAPAAKGEASYVGIEECGSCHGRALALWKTTKHAKAWNTLEQIGKQFNLDCIKCHVTGFDEPGGSNLAFNDNLRDVQCEVCHGPGSKHVGADGKGMITRMPVVGVCQGCHNEEHSDTFAFEAYLRDITGVGHGEDFRATLGQGPTGHELRSAALEKAGSLIGQGCPK